MRFVFGLLLLVTPALLGCGAEPAEPGDDTRCVTDEAAGTVDCQYETFTLQTGVGALNPRNVIYQVPVGDAPANGWPTVLFFQGSFHPASQSFSGYDGMRFGGHFQAETVRDLLDAGYAVIAPDAHLNGALYWDSNLWLYSAGEWDWAEDKYFIDDLLEAMGDADNFGPLDLSTLFAMGISSGGYMTSRMAITLPERFVAITIVAASYASCYGGICDVPLLDFDHPPTLFLHGEQDATVPIYSMDRYKIALDRAGVENRRVTEADAGHGYISTSAVETVRWFNRFATR